METYIYCWIRKDLPKGQQIIQMSHACWAQSKFSDAVMPNMVLFEVKNEEELLEITQFLYEYKFGYDLFLEPDFNEEATALCSEAFNKNDPNRQLFKDFKLYR